MNDTNAAEALLARLSRIVGPAHVLTADADKAPYLVEPRGYYRGRTQAIVRPGSAEDVSAVLKLANETRTPIVPQGGNTGLVGGQIPDESGREIVLSLERLDKIRTVDAEGGTLTAEAGAILEKVQTAAADAGMLFPLTLGAQGSCRIGGNISTNAGGTGVLAYGNTRSLVLGLEVVLPTGEIWDGLRGLLKDNTGYDLKQLFIGAEGTLGIITAAVLKLLPAPRGKAVALVGLDSPEAALRLFRHARDRARPDLTAFELIPRILIDMLVKHLADTRDPMSAPHDWYVLLELSSGVSHEDAVEMAETALGEALSEGLIGDAVMASSEAQASHFWRLRHAMSDIQKPEGGSLKHDVSVPVASVPDFIRRASEAVTKAIPGARPVPFGHLGDGNIHFNISQPAGVPKADFMPRAAEVHALVHGIVAEMGGSIAAEHGIGRYKRELMKNVKSDIELDLMRRIKRAFDPNNILNPGRGL